MNKYGVELKITINIFTAIAIRTYTCRYEQK